MTGFVQRIRAAAWLGWQIESNWADAIVFGVYTLIRPVGTALILGGMFWAVGAMARRPDLFAAFYLANAVHEYVTRAVVGMGWVVVEEREQYETLKLVYTSPVGMRTYLWGRATVKFALASITAVVVLALGWFLFGVRWNWSTVAWIPLVVSFALILIATLFLGFLVAGFALLMPRIAMSMNEGIAIALYMLCGVIFPIDLMPHGLRELSLVLPFTYGYEAVRRFLLGHGASALLSRLSDLQLVGLLALTTLVMSAIAQRGYTVLDNKARREGKLDQTTVF